MKTHDVLLSPEMARARAEGRKTVTRRIMKCPKNTEVIRLNHRDASLWVCESAGFCTDIKCPYGAPGDRIRWLTTWAVSHLWDDLKPSELPRDTVGRLWSYHSYVTKGSHFGRFRPGRYLPLFLRDRMPVDEIVSVRVERLHDITEEDCLLEGMPKWNTPIGLRYCFGQLWNSINGPGSWEKNPWVWRIELKPILK